MSDGWCRDGLDGSTITSGWVRNDVLIAEQGWADPKLESDEVHTYVHTYMDAYMHT